MYKNLLYYLCNFSVGLKLVPQTWCCQMPWTKGKSKLEFPVQLCPEHCGLLPRDPLVVPHRSISREPYLMPCLPPAPFVDCALPATGLPHTSPWLQTAFYCSFLALTPVDLPTCGSGHTNWAAHWSHVRASTTTSAWWPPQEMQS